MNLSELKKQEEEIMAMLEDNLQKQRAINRKAFMELHQGIDVGDIIEYGGGRTGTRRAVVVFFVNEKYGPVSYVVSNFNKDGNISQVKKRLWYWDLKTLKLISKKESAQL